MKLFLKNKQLLLTLLLIIPVQFAHAFDKTNPSKVNFAPFPQPDAGYVSDIANLLSLEEEERIEDWLWQVEYHKNIEIIVVTIDSIDEYTATKLNTIEEFSTGLFNKYRIGNLPKNNGILLLIAKKDRKTRIELGSGYGQSRDRDAKKIITNYILPEFRNGEYGTGIINGTREIIDKFADMRVGFPWKTVYMSIAAIAFILIGLSFIRNGKKGWGYVFIGISLVLILLIIYIFVVIRRSGPDTSSSTSLPGGFGGGFGGGSSGGGGATGGW